MHVKCITTPSTFCLTCQALPKLNTGPVTAPFSQRGLCKHLPLLDLHFLLLKTELIPQVSFHLLPRGSCEGQGYSKVKAL